MGEHNNIGYLHLGIKNIFNSVMAFSFTKKVEGNNIQAPSNSEQQLQLTKKEVEALLMAVKSSSFKGEQVEEVFNLVLKLQEYYIALKD